MADDLDCKKVNEYLPPHVQYACRYWVEHLRRCAFAAEEPAVQAATEVHEFLKVHLLHWLEAMSLIARVDEAVKSVIQLETWLSVAGVGAEHSPRYLPPQAANHASYQGFVKDAKRFILYARAGIQAAPLQVYSAALSFAPEDSVVRRHFAAQLPDWVSLQGPRDTSWDACLQVPEGHSSQLTAAVFSPDGQTLAWASKGTTVRLWDSSIGQSRHTLEGHSSSVSAIVFSPDGQTLASASEDTTVRLWDSSTGQCRHTLKGHSSVVYAVVFSPDGHKLASASWDHTVRLWDSSTGQSRHTLEGHSGVVRTVVLSLDGQTLNNLYYSGSKLDGANQMPFPTMLQEALECSDSKLVRELLIEQFDIIATGEYLWLRELDDVGYTRDEIAALLLEEANDAPWIYFQPRQFFHIEIKPEIHIQGCTHGNFPTDSSSSGRSLMLAGTSAALGENGIRNAVQELCGLAGVVPISRNIEEWNGNVRFEEHNTIAIVSYTSLEANIGMNFSTTISRISKALGGFCTAAGQVAFQKTSARLNWNSGG
ncbi:hypothetical protein LTR28_003609 [Elasticomyces elasticus]|nr:hypothetical protein LTR28_003609 [Elasticomyces elasticus]